MLRRGARDGPLVLVKCKCRKVLKRAQKYFQDKLPAIAIHFLKLTMAKAYHMQ
ncbi:hypothetical protein M5D96_001468 [Drosophila gunungcola]|uniref:Uncharacterized protein n=1 Tax=Drosophila gunungcola TaxID=103775 RepID=A0A9P9YY63_9MUSC|nr:hypothetical protein M5D96_001468 [Drosophila gunungcola]